MLVAFAAGAAGPIKLVRVAMTVGELELLATVRMPVK
jgi:hypothetical protein